MTDLLEVLRASYVAKGIVTAQSEALPLHTHCSSALACWAKLGPELRPKAEVGGISLPWVGREYQPGGVLLVGINMNEHGGLDAWGGLIREALAELPRKNRMYASEDYAGSMFQQRAGWYAAVIFRHLGIEEFNDGRDVRDWNRQPSQNALICRAWERLAATNQVKCSPVKSEATPRSRPTEEMWKNCAPMWLAIELEVLRPSVLLVLGIDRNLEQFRSTWSTTELGASDGVFRGRAHLSTGSVEVVALTHPAANDGCSEALVSQLDDMLLSYPLRHA